MELSFQQNTALARMGIFLFCLFTSALLHTNAYGYLYDPIGHQKSAKPKPEAQDDRDFEAVRMHGARNGIPRHSGNCHMLFDGTRFYTWDAENRLASVSSNGVDTITYAYDFMHRRIRKTTPSATHAYVYDGWNLIQETIAHSGTTSTVHYVWGLDLSGTLQGTGGVGGLLAVIIDGVPYFPCYDANGNITEYVDASGNVVAHYEYSPFGETIEQSGPLADQFRFRFSTKYHDPETGLYYYGRRYYLPPLGCWLSRDPIGEDGGLNLLGFCLNAPLIFVDAIGEQINDPPGTVSAPCCGGVAYDAGKSCCINGQIINRDAPPVSTGVRKCCLYGRRVLGSDWGGRIPVHCWVEFSGGSTGFYPGNGKIGRGYVKWPHDPAYEGTSTTCDEEIKISPCDGDAKAFKDYVSTSPLGEKAGDGIYRDGIYVAGIRDCSSWADDLINRCREASRR